VLDVTGFDWDSGNINKKMLWHKVSAMECEQMFFNQPLAVAENSEHSKLEKRHFSLGVTDAWRKLFVVFTVRKEKIRVISARDICRKERLIYEKN